jgi:hypothetical protein
VILLLILPAAGGAKEVLKILEKVVSSMTQDERRSTNAKEDRVRRLYRRQLEGLSARALVYEHVEREQVSINTAWRDWAEVKLLVDEDWKSDRENMLARLQHMRTKLFNQAIKKGQLQTASQVLDSIGRVIGESTEIVNIQAPDLTIKIQGKDD